MDSINDEILRIKRELAAIHGNDVDRIAADARSRQGKVVSFPPRPYKPEQNAAPKPSINPLSESASTAEIGG